MHPAPPENRVTSHESRVAADAVSRDTPSAKHALLALAAGVAVVSTASILIRFVHAQGVPSLSIAATRLTLAALVLLPIAWVHARAEIRQLAARDIALTLASGTLLGVHFWSWISSLEYTSVASSTVLVTTNPLWVGLASVMLLREKLTFPVAGGLVLSVLGMLVTFLAETRVPTPNPALGNALALVGAMAASGYLLLGRALRGRLSLTAYVALAYTAAAVLLCCAALLSGAPLHGHSASGWLFLVLLALGPQLIGHTTFNWSLRHLSATFVALAILGEPVGSAVLAWLILGERFGALQLAGFALLLAGIFLAARGEARPGSSSH
jgi:drug/metabolite transporter (DMT)-like permease